MSTIEHMSLDDLRIVLGWAAAEGWNPGLDDAEAFYAADPAGFLIARVNESPVAAISVVKQDERHGFLGLYICTPDYRGQGIGWSLWQTGMQYLEGMTVGLDGVVEQQDNYRQSGFELAYRNIRYAGVPLALTGKKAECQPADQRHLEAILQLDQSVHGLSREAFLTNWVSGTEHRRTLVLHQGDQLIGYGTIRACQQGHKVGPLIAPTIEDARTLLSSLSASCNASEIMLDVPEPNNQAVRLAQAAGLQAVFETARMYRGTPPDYHLQPLFGVTTFELG
ncbi:MAG: GNAT family N-acetyltransferase [Rhodothermales bacterium]|nr:GNAT family N-acetyltransferase [Rhodothermales bacterium]